MIYWYMNLYRKLKIGQDLVLTKNVNHTVKRPMYLIVGVREYNLIVARAI